MYELFKPPAAVLCVPLSSGHTAETLRASQRLLPLLRPVLCGLVWVAVVRPHRACCIRAVRRTVLGALPLFARRLSTSCLDLSRPYTPRFDSSGISLAPWGSALDKIPIMFESGQHS